MQCVTIHTYIHILRLCLWGTVWGSVTAGVRIGTDTDQMSRHLFHLLTEPLCFGSNTLLSSLLHQVWRLPLMRGQFAHILNEFSSTLNDFYQKGLWDRWECKRDLSKQGR